MYFGVEYVCICKQSLTACFAAGDEEEASAEWTVRRQCAGVFDAVCSSGALLPEQILSIALPVAKDMLQVQC